MDEVHQTFVEGRVGAPLDVAIDTVGALVGVLVWLRLERAWGARA
jgi:VanZ family protein